MLNGNNMQSSTPSMQIGGTTVNFGGTGINISLLREALTGLLGVIGNSPAAHHEQKQERSMSDILNAIRDPPVNRACDCKHEPHEPHLPHYAVMYVEPVDPHAEFKAKIAEANQKENDKIRDQVLQKWIELTSTFLRELAATEAKGSQETKDDLKVRDELKLVLSGDDSQQFDLSFAYKIMDADFSPMSAIGDKEHIRTIFKNMCIPRDENCTFSMLKHLCKNGEFSRVYGFAFGEIYNMIARIDFLKTPARQVHNQIKIDSHSILGCFPPRVLENLLMSLSEKIFVDSLEELPM